jgi:hypothetical protein
MDKAAEGINEKYDEQANALSKIADINSKIAAQQKQQLTLADALTSGDISAAAAAAQEMRATQAADQITSQQEALAAARDLEVANLRNSAGQTREQIEERQWQISQEIYAIEQQRKVLEDQIVAIQETKIAPLNAARIKAEREIRDLEDQVYNLQVGKLAQAEAYLKKKQEELDKIQEELNLELDAIEAQRDKWIQAQNAIDLARVKSEAFAESMKLNVGLVQDLVNAWNSMGAGGTLGTSLLDGSDGDALSATISAAAAVDSAQAAMDAAIESGNPYAIRNAGIALDAANKAYNAVVGSGGTTTGTGGGGKGWSYMANGGIVSKGSDTVPTMLTPGEFVMNKNATKAFGPMLAALNGSKYPSMLGNIGTSSYPTMGNNISSSLISQTYPSMSSTNISPINSTSINAVNDNSTAVYNYSVGINVTGSNSSPDEIARAVMTQIKTVDAQRIRNQRA